MEKSEKFWNSELPSKYGLEYQTIIGCCEHLMMLSKLIMPPELLAMYHGADKEGRTGLIYYMS